jgi:2-hydroxymuconate-semialdehyde hydrolase
MPTAGASRHRWAHGDGASTGGAAMSVPADARGHLLAGLPISRRRLEVAGISTAVLEAGQGRPLVLLHGGIECGGAYWAPVIARLAETHHLVVPDAPGLGESEPANRPGIPVLTDWLGDLLAQTHAERPMLVAHSLLGSVAARYAAGHDALSRLVIYAAPGIAPYRMPAGLRYAAIRFSISPTARNAERFERFALFDLDATRALDAPWFGAFDAYLRSRAAVPHVKRTMRRLIGAGTRQIPDDELRRIKAPTALLWGRHDRMVPIQLAEHASETLRWPLQVVEDAGHVPHIEAPAGFLTALSAIECTPSSGR